MFNSSLHAFRRGNHLAGSYLVRSGAFALLTLIAAINCSAQTNVLTYHNDNSRTGQNLTETILKPSIVNSTNFRKLGTMPVTGLVDAEPLYVAGLTVAGVVHNVVFVVTEHDLVYAFDADTFKQLWSVSVLGSGETTSDDRGCSQVTPEIGITSTPVIDLSAGPNGAIFVIAMSKNGSTYYQRLHALDITTGAELFGGPQTITATFPGTGDNSNGTNVIFDPSQYKERAALLLLNGQIYTSWASHCDDRPYTGWFMAFNETTLARTSVLNVTPNGYDGAIWMSGGGLAADSSGFIYALDGNGTFDSTLNAGNFPSQGDYGNAFLKLSSSGGLAVADYFEMDNGVSESSNDVDLGSGGVMLLPDLTDANGIVWHLAVGAGKDGNLYVVSRDSMGKFSSGSNKNYQFLSGVLGSGIWSVPAYFNNTVYYAPTGGSILAFGITNAKLAGAPSSQSPTTYTYPGAFPSISANGATNGILWAVENNSSAAVLHAYDATNLGTELYNSNQASGSRDHFGAGNKYIVPMISNGKVYVGTPNSVAVFGLVAATPTFSPAAGAISSSQPITISDTTPGASIYYTTDGVTTPTQTPSELYTGSFTLSASTKVQAIAVAAGYANSAVSSASYTVQGPVPAATPTFSPAAGTISSTQPITISDTTSGASIYYTTDGVTTPTQTPSELYSGSFTLSASTKVQAIAVAAGYTNSAVGSASYTVQAPIPAATPTFSPTGGAITTSQPITISDATMGAAIYYTTDGVTTPTQTPSELYSAPFTLPVSASTKVQAIAVASGYLNSSVGSGTYTVTAGSGLPSGLVARWTFNDGSGTTAADSSGNGYNATLFNGVTWVAGKLNGAISANGANQYVSTPAVNLSATSAVTIAAWVNRTYSTAGGHVLIEASSNYNSSTTGFGLFPDDADCGGIQVSVHGDGGYSVNCFAQPSSGVWHHLVAVYDKTQAGTAETSLYIDGVLQTPTKNLNTTANTNAFGSNPIYLFSRGGTQEFNAGLMDDLQIYNRHLTAAEVQQIYTGSVPTLVSIAVTPANPSIAKGRTQAFTATGTYSDNSTQNLTSSATWTSATTSVATITSAGVATGVGTGTSTIQATSGSISGSTVLTVTPPALVSIAVTPANASVQVGSTPAQYTATGTYSDNSTQNLTSSVTWVSTTTSVATITSAGVVTPVAAGSTTIQATSGSITGSTGLTVTSSGSGGLPSGLVGYWTFNEGSGTTAADSSGNGYTATLFNGVTWTAGKVGGAISANGVNQYVSIPAVNLSATSAVTIAAWVNRTYSTAGGHVLLEATTNYNSSTTGFGLFPDDATCGGIQVAVHGNSGYSVNCFAQPSSGAWHHLVIVYDKTQAGTAETSLYIDGVLQTPTQHLNTTTNKNAFGSNPIYLYSRGGTQEFNAGLMSDLQIYNRHLTATEIQNLP